MSVQFQVYIRYGCHLCDEMLEHLNILAREYDFDVTAIDITGKDDLERLYGNKVPVLMCQQQEVCHYSLDVQRFRELTGI
jgi:thiol-disulfide isomerase/thioredoxin